MWCNILPYAVTKSAISKCICIPVFQITSNTRKNLVIHVQQNSKRIFASVRGILVKLAKYMLQQRQATIPKIQGQTRKCGHEELFHEARSFSIHTEDLCYSSGSITRGSSLHFLLNQCLSAGLPSVMLLLANIKLCMHCQKCRCPSISALFVVHADVGYVLHLRARKIHLMSMLITPLIRWVWVFDSRRDI